MKNWQKAFERWRDSGAEVQPDEVEITYPMTKDELVHYLQSEIDEMDMETVFTQCQCNVPFENISNFMVDNRPFHVYIQNINTNLTRIRDSVIHFSDGNDFESWENEVEECFQVVLRLKPLFNEIEDVTLKECFDEILDFLGEIKKDCKDLFTPIVD